MNDTQQKNAAAARLRPVTSLVIEPSSAIAHGKLIGLATMINRPPRRYQLDLEALRIGAIVARQD